MEQESDGRPVVNCEKCLFCSKHVAGWKFCLALAELLENTSEPKCSGKCFLKINPGDRYEQLVDAFRNLDA